MTPNEPPSVSVSRPGSTHPGVDDLRTDLRTVVWLRGEPDIATRVQLSIAIARAAHRDDADIVVDLSGVTFMNASTIGTLVNARNRLRAHSRSLFVRGPSPQTRRLLDLCGLARAAGDHPAPAPMQGAPARQAAHASARRHVEAAGAIRQRRDPL